MHNDTEKSIEFGVSVLQNLFFSDYDFVQKEHHSRIFLFPNLFNKTYKHQVKFKESAENYVRGIIERFGVVKILGMNKPMPLLNLYVRANILEKVSAKAGKRVEDMEIFFDLDRRRFGNLVETKDAEAIINKLSKFIVLGKPGAGKTTFLRYITLAILSERSVIKKRRLPIFITLREWADKHCELMDYIVDQFDICGFEKARQFIERLLKQGKCLILFDGLDEVSQETNLDSIIYEVRNFTEKYTTNQFVISCRVSAYNDWFERFTDVEMADFNESQIETFVYNWFSSEPNIAKECIKSLKESVQLRELASVPLLLTLLCITYDENNYFPSNRAELYKEAIDALLRKWDTSRRIRRNDPYKQLSLMQKENMFARIAFGTFTESRYFIHEKELTKMIGNFLLNLPNFSDKKMEVDSYEVLRTIESHHGIFVERARQIHSYAHLTFQEYFTAKFIVDNDNSLNRSLEKMVKEHMYHSKWKEVFLLTSGMLSGADELLLLMIKKNRELLKDPQLNAFIETIKKTILPTKSQYSIGARKSMAILYILGHARNLARDLSRDRFRGRTRYRDQIRNIDSALKLVRDIGRTREIARALACEIDNNLNRTLGGEHSLSPNDENHLFDRFPNFERDKELDIQIEKDLALNLNMDIGFNFDSLEYYNHKESFTITLFPNISLLMNGNYLIAQCLNSAAYLSNSTREYVLSMLLAPLTEEEKAAMGIKDEE